VVAVGATALLATALSLAITQRSSSAPASPFRHLRLGLSAPVYPLTPLREGTLWNRLVVSGALHMPLIASRPRDGAPAPALARAWSVTDSGFTLGVGLTRGLRWHDGPPVTARDVAFSLPYLAAQGHHPFLARYLARVDTVSRDSILLRFRVPVALHGIHWLVDTPVLPRHIWSTVARADTFSGPDALVGCGPFRLGWVDVDRRGATLLRAGDFPRPIGVDGVSFVQRGSADSLVDDLRHDRLDAVATFGEPLPGPVIQSLMQGRSTVRLLSTAYAGIAYAIRFSARDGLGAHRTFRTAVASALDFDALARALATPLARRPALSLTPSAAWSASPSASAWKTDVRSAHAALSSLGLADRDGDGIREGRNGERFTLMIGAAPGCERAARHVALALRMVGLRVRVVPPDTVPEPPLSVIPITPFSALLAGYPDVAAGPFTHGEERDPDYLRRVQGAVEAPDEGSQREALAALQDYDADQLPVLALAWDDIVVPVSGRHFGGWSVSSTQGIPHMDLWSELTPLPPPPPLRWPAPSLLFVAGLALGLSFALLRTTAAQPRMAGALALRLGHVLALQPGLLRRAAARGEARRERRRGARERRRVVMTLPPGRERRRGSRERRRGGGR
jgi:peptide/nickel transport system substrate-binding protein